MNARVIWPAGAKLGEGPVWDERDGLLYFVDIKGRTLHRCTLDGDERQTWRFTDPLCWIIPRAAKAGFIAGFKSGFAELSLDPFAVTPIGAPEPERRSNRLNDAKADPFGRIWAGSMDDEERQGSGALYRLNTNLTWKRMDDGYGVANGPAFSPDGRTLYHTDSAARTVYAFDLAADGAIANKRIFLRFEDEAWGAPDGMAADARGGVWIAHWGGARVSRFTAEGKLDRFIPLPVALITSCVFAGENLERMFCTSAAVGREHEPGAGALFEIDPGVRGAQAFAFNG